MGAATFNTLGIIDKDKDIFRKQDICGLLKYTKYKKS